MNYVEELVNTLSNLRPEMFCIVACIAVGYLVRITPVIPNKWIPSICIVVGAFVYPFLTSTGRVSPDSVNPLMRIVLTGLILGALSFAIHDQVLSKLERYIPGLRKVLKVSDNTKQFRKDASEASEVEQPEEKQ